MTTNSGNQKPASPATIGSQSNVMRELDLADQSAVEDVHRGFIASVPGARITNERGDVVWDIGRYGFLAQEKSPYSVNPSLWRMARLNAVHGLFKVAERTYQVRGFDLANITFIEGDSGLIIIDPLTFKESAAAAFRLYTQHRGNRPVRCVIYSHSHRDHFGGVRGVTSEEDVASGRVQIIAPERFMEEVVSEAILAGIPMHRRAAFQFGRGLPPGPLSHVDSGLGKAVGFGSYGLIPPTRTIKEPRERHTIDGIEIEFQLTPGTEAPAEMNFFFPALRALNLAENACQTMHNLCPMRGAKTRDTLAWARYLDEALEQYVPHVDVVYAQHHWPVWGTDRVREFVSEQRDMYRFLHDQTLRLMSHGLTPTEIAEELMMPKRLAKRWHARGYYGALVHNVAAIYAHYMGPYDGNPANLHRMTPAAGGAKYVEYMGGIEAVMERARADFERGEFRWVVQVLNHAVFAYPDHGEARLLAADAMEQLGYQAESATWRNSYLLGAKELREGPPNLVTRSATVNSDVVTQLPIDLFFDFLAIRIHGERLADLRAKFDWIMTDDGTCHRLTLSNGALNHREGTHGPGADAVISASRSTLASAIQTGRTLLQLLEADEMKATGNIDKVRSFCAGLDTFDPAFAIVEP